MSPFLFASKFLSLLMQIGIISDTHNILPKSVFKYFKDVEYIFHAGDIGRLEILEELKQIAPLIAVYGNIDETKIKMVIPPIFYITLKGRILCLVHDIGNVKNFSYELFRTNKNADIIIHGHTHQPSYEIYQKKIFINPGSASYPRMQKSGTIAIVSFDKYTLLHEFINLED
jgi:putative phosphoesterase